MAELEIRNLHVSVEDKQILKGLDLDVEKGKVHALMGPNGSGKSTLANAIMGHPALEVTEGTITFKGEDFTEADPDERSRAGLFMAFQYPVAIPGVSVSKYLRMILNAHREARGEAEIKIKDFAKTAQEAMELANIPKDFSSRYLNDGFSGGEKKRMELLQLALLRPEIAVLDETDSGLDIDALRTVAEGVNKFAGPDMGVLIITHYQRILHMVKPDFVHVMFEGRIVKEGGPELVGDARGEGLRLDPRGGRGWRQRLASGTWSRRPRVRRPSRSRRSAPPSRRSSARSTASRSPTSTAAPAPSGCWPRSRPSTATSAPTTRTSTAARTRSRPRRPPPTRGRGRPSPTTSAPPTAARSSSSATRPRRSTSSRGPGARPTSAPGDRILLTEMEHHSNVVPWQQLAERVGAEIDWVPVDDDGLLEMDALAELLERGPKLVAVAHVSNVLGTENPLAEISRLAHEAGALVLADGAQAAPKLPLDVAALGVDFYALTGHKLYAPTGIGALWARLDLLRAMPPFLGGGSMIRKVTKEGVTFADPPARFEAGTPAIAQAIGMASALRWLDGLGMDAVREHEQAIADYALERVAEVPGLRVFGPPRGPDRLGPVSFEIDGIHAHDVSEILDRHGVAVRAGHHCAQPLMDRFGIAATARASFGVYTTEAEIDRLVEGLHDARRVFGLD